MQRNSGQIIEIATTGERFRAFVPADLPPQPPLEFDSALLALLDDASRALGRLDGIASLLPDTDLFIYHYQRKEALLSSQIEGTQSSFSDLVMSEIDAAPGVPQADIDQVSQYIAAMRHGLERLACGFPLSLRLLREIHEVLLSQGRGERQQPGEFRRSQNWIGGSRPGNALYVPPPVDRLDACLDNLERFIHETDTGLPVSIKAGLLHAQFESIHPFLDGNGRLGRLLITLLLCERGVLRQPLLYLSLYFKIRRDEYYRELQSVRSTGDWEAWLAFFLRGVAQAANEAVTTATELQAMFARDLDRVRAFGRIAASCERLLGLLRIKPIMRIAEASKTLDINRTSITHCFERLVEAGIVSEITGYQKHRLYRYDRYLEVLSTGTEPL